MKIKKILLILFMLLIIPTNIHAEQSFNLIEADFEQGIGSRAISNSSKTTICYSSGCRNPYSSGIRMQVVVDGTPIKTYTSPLAGKNQKTSISLTIGREKIEYATMNVGDVFVTNINTTIKPYELSNALDGAKEGNVIKAILNAKGTDFYKLLCDAAPTNCSAMEKIKSDTEDEDKALKAVKKFAEYANKAYVVVEPIFHISHGSESWWNNGQPFYDNEVKYVGLDNTAYIIGREQAEADKETLKACSSGLATQCLENSSMWIFLKVTPNQGSYLGFKNGYQSYLNCSNCTGQGWTEAAIIKEKSRREAEINEKYSDAIKSYNHYVNWLQKIPAKPSNFFEGTLTFKALAKKFQELSCHEAGYTNGTGRVKDGNCSAPVSTSASSHLGSINTLLYMDQQVGTYGRDACLNNWNSIASDTSKCGLNVFKVNINTNNLEPTGICKYENNKLLKFNKNLNMDEEDIELSCCEYVQTDNKKYNWRTEGDYNNFKLTTFYKLNCTTDSCRYEINKKKLITPDELEEKDCCLEENWSDEYKSEYNNFYQNGQGPKYKELCLTNINTKCSFTGTDTSIYQYSLSGTLYCCDINNYDINPTNQTGWNKWYTDNCQTVTYACTLKDLKNIKSSNDSKFNCCFNINEYSNSDKNIINYSGGLENYIKDKAKKDKFFGTVLGVCYPTTSCQVDTLILCPTCNSGDSDGSIADTVSYKTESTSIVELEYNTEMAKKCVIGNSNLLSFSNPYCKAYCGEQIEYDYPIYANTTVLAGTKITVGKNGTFSPITLTGTKKCFVESIASDIFKQNMNDINSSIAEKAKEINDLVEQINSVPEEPVTSNTCAYKYGSCDVSPHCEICSSRFEQEFCQNIYNSATNCYADNRQTHKDCLAASEKDPTNSTLRDNCDKITEQCDLMQSQAILCSSARKCTLENWSRYREYSYTEYSSNGTATKSFCENEDPRASWNVHLSTLREQYRKLEQTRNSYINAMKECMNVQNIIGYNEFDPQLSLDYISGKYSTMDIQLNNDISISSSGSIGTTPYNTISYDVYDDNGEWDYSGTANYITLSASDINNHEFSITKTVNFYLGNNFSTYTYVDLSNGNSTGTSSDTSVYIGPHLPVQYDSVRASNNSITIRINTLGDGNKFNNELNSNNDCKNYECSFNVYNNIITSKGLNVVYRPISLSNPFPEESGNGRLTGSNWCSNGDCKNTNNTVKTVITNNRGVTEDEIYTMTPLYTIELTPEDIINIRGYNLLNKYGDFTLKCTTDKAGYKCRSDFIRETYSRIINENKSCALGKGNNCRDNGKDVY